MTDHRTLDLRKFINDWTWESGHGPTLFHAPFDERKEALLKFAEALREALLAAPAPKPAVEPTAPPAQGDGE